MTKVLVTIGPASINAEAITEFAKHTKLFRLNGSHNTLEWHKEIVSKIRALVPDAFILLDIPGVKPRTSNTEPILIKKGQTVVFGSPTAFGAQEATLMVGPCSNDDPDSTLPESSLGISGNLPTGIKIKGNFLYSC